MNKKYVIFAIIVIIIIAICFGSYKIASSYMFNEKKEIPNAKLELINHIKNIENTEEKKNQIDFSVKQNIITQEEANELY